MCIIRAICLLVMKLPRRALRTCARARTPVSVKTGFVCENRFRRKACVGTRFLSSARVRLGGGRAAHHLNLQGRRHGFILGHECNLGCQGAAA